MNQNLTQNQLQTNPESSLPAKRPKFEFRGSSRGRGRVNRGGMIGPRPPPPPPPTSFNSESNPFANIQIPEVPEDAFDSPF